MTTFTQILVPLDFSDHSVRALERAKSVAEKFGSILHLLTVIPDPFVLPDPANTYALPPDYVDNLRRDAEARLRQSLSQAERTQFRAQDIVLFGNPYQQIRDYAQDHAIDLIVMGTHGRGAVAQAFLGSVAERVVRTAPCPVMTVR
jgi:universal stress protein A